MRNRIAVLLGLAVALAGPAAAGVALGREAKAAPARQCIKQQGLENAFHVQVQFYRTIPGQPGVYSVHGPYPYVRERYADGVRTLYYAGPGPAQETALATMTSADGWEIIGDPSGQWDILSVVPNES